jgi:hypothetical protein
MADTGAPWNIPYAEPADLVRDWPALSEDVADEVAAGLTAANSVIRQVQQVITTTNFTTTSQVLVDLTGVIVTVVPQDAANRIHLWFTAETSNNSTPRKAIFTFRRDTTDIFEEVEVAQERDNLGYSASMMFDEVAGSTTSRTYSIRCSTSAGTLTVRNSSLIVMEYTP